ncbi:MAG: NAD(P)-dependent glycerol-3-phosphate dehydrogenase [Halorhodospira halophila]|uniref:NAD(P)H-dependent glycerol-3-phosphate dehydrogenase n=1 Tax=Halorhodospira TaxID=85108 RepID=UPI0019131DE0|nr:NAD(P)H-dependent glycerol-3-phosphate dehydrogenase [Halorhodospira halophila]MCG5534283.1 NAD(P)-dependent glycerol-3-phosphate dehydrogenase [Halorhodospira sp. 9621]MCG5538798.1 NAD(P)-dependent glycerol-3-phosphate dehydrogenase [Halorhodospira sp. 9622]MCG5544596.1 NAD(P)-dependent glycerol-3-phosphate dehydrogenase [Halorhodospira sp. 9628]MBK5936342.1 glycerol-3-phosphate dehydrogenase [Halorhodospira halophila]MBK5943569.1 glycerol-3-phosphate dehydrogenase [Halorhodospira halophil
MATIAVLGAGAWGTALASVLGRNGHAVQLWTRDAEHAAAINAERVNRRHLPDCPLPQSLAATADLDTALAGTEWLLIAVPSSAFRGLIERLAPYRPGKVVWATKGLESESGGFLHGVVEGVLDPTPAMAVISGPSFAAEVGRGLPTAITVAATDSDLAAEVVHAFHNDRFRPYSSTDMIGVELGGAVKNVLAVATGVSDGLGLGANARAALVTRGLAEISRLGAALGADPQTLIGLAGMGDLLLTCTDDQSRNRRFGFALGQGADVDRALASVGSTVEGARTAAELHTLAARHGVEMPICNMVYRVVGGDTPLEQAVRELMERTPKAEFDD